MRKGFFIILSLVFLTGCYATTRDVQNIDVRLATAESKIAQLEQALRAQKEDISALRAQMADISATLEELKTDMRGVRDTVERSEKGISDLSYQLAALDSRIEKLEKGLVQKKETREDPTKMYNLSLQLFRAGQYADARDSFRQFLKIFPEDPLACNAQYWLGESLLALGKKREAILAFNKVIKGYPNCPKIPSALLKQALVFLSLGDKNTARVLLKKVVEDYPDTDQARIAGVKLRYLTKRRKRKK